MGDAVVDIFLERLKKQLLLHNANLFDGVMKYLEALMYELQMLEGAIIELSGNQNKSFEQRALLNNIKKAVDEAEDAVDYFIVQRAKYRHRSVAKLVHTFHPSSSFRKIAVGMRNFRVLTDKLMISQHMAEERTLPPKSKFKQARIVEERYVVGFDEPAEELISSITGDSAAGLDVIGIVGMGGLGKTTLARKVYGDDRIVGSFRHRAWGDASMGCRVENVLATILRQLGHASEDAYEMSHSKLAYEIKRCLKDTEYFIVLDDLWTIETWEALRVAFPNNSNRGRILLTTRNRLIAQYANLNREPYHLKFLNTSESFELLKKNVFGNSKCPEDLIKSGLQIAQTCGGLPLAIVVISGTLLAKREMKDWWENVAVRVNSFLKLEGRGFFNVVAQSYNTLPGSVQLCFLYFGLLPKGAVPVSKLIRLWIAEGFIPDERKLGLEDMAIACLDDLVNRSLVIPVSRRSNGEIRTCKIHDTLHEFCKEEAEMQGIYQDINMSNVGSYNNNRRICVDAKDWTSLFKNYSIDKVRTILTFSSDTIILDLVQTEKIRAFTRIRILEARSIKFPRLPRQLQELVLLRYLAFSCDFDSIPSFISKLWNLQTLIVTTSKWFIGFPEEIWKLYELRHLETNASALLPVPPESISTIGQENMQTLSTIAPESCTKEVFSRVPDVKKLGIRGELDSILSPESQLIDNFERLEQLTKLKLINDLTSSSVVQNLSAKFSKVVARLTKLTISGTSLGWDSMTILGEMEKLEVLKVKNNAFIGDQWSGNQGIFPSLILLSIDTTELKTWEVSNNQFKRLTSLLLKNCENLQAIPTLLADLPSFQNLDVHNCCTSVLQSAQEIHRKGAISRLTIVPSDV